MGTTQISKMFPVQAGVQPESKEGLPLDPTVQLAMDWPWGLQKN